jgi:hypothetical protein
MELCGAFIHGGKTMSNTGYTFLAKYLNDLREYAPIYRASFLREILELVRDGKPAPNKDPQLCVYESIVKIFEGCEESLQDNILNYFLRVELPSLEADEREEKARCDAIDSLLECVNEKSTKEIIAFTKQLESEEYLEKSTNLNL